MSDIFSLSASELAAQLREGEISLSKSCQQYIERIEKFEKDVKAWAHFDKKLLLEKLQKQMSIEFQENHWTYYMDYHCC